MNQTGGTEAQLTERGCRGEPQQRQTEGGETQTSQKGEKGGEEQPSQWGGLERHYTREEATNTERKHVVYGMYGKAVG